MVSPASMGASKADRRSFFMDSLGPNPLHHTNALAAGKSALADGTLPAQTASSQKRAQPRRHRNAQRVPDQDEGRGHFRAMKTIDGGGSGPRNQSPRGARHAEPRGRQT